jgi:hypothetical protein
LGWALGSAGKREEAEAVYQELAQRSANEYISPLYLSWVLSGLQKTDEAFEWLEKAFEEKNMYLLFWKLPVFDSLTCDPRFQDLRKEFQLPG